MTGQRASAGEKKVVCRPGYRQVRANVKLSSISEVFSKQIFPTILGGNNSDNESNRFSYWASNPREVFEFDSGQERPFEKLHEKIQRYQLDSKCGADMPKRMFFGGWMGYFSYELGRYIEKLPRTTVDDLKMPLMRLCFYDRVLCYDHIEGIFRLTALLIPGDNESLDEKLNSLEKMLDMSLAIDIADPKPVDIENIDVSLVKCNMDKRYYLEAVDKIKRYIYDGQVYQVNFSQRFECHYECRDIDVYHWQNLYNPSGYAAYIGAKDFSIVSASPEMFITITDGLISTRPIKGTRPRLAETKENEQVNAAYFAELLHSEKDMAELNMIVDLERNDLARICQAGTRKVVGQRKVEAHPTVYHAVATVAGKLRDGVTFCDVLRGVFPGGSITGAPKVSSMEIIDETEPTERGVYTGSIGFIGIDGNVCLNIAIRTIIICGNKAFAQSGGGIVADSDPQAEWDETITKARALIAGIESVSQDRR